MWPVIFATLEIGTWVGWLAAKTTSRSGIRETLINGTRAARSFDVVDRQLEKQTKEATKNQRRIAAGVIRGVRFAVNTRAFELVGLKLLLDWQKSKSVQSVRLCI